jgi:opacity protein-like surface antigen
VSQKSAIALAASAALLMVCSQAQAATVTVDALTPFGSWLDTGLDLNPSSTYGFTVIDPATLWSAGSNSPFSRESTADGIPATGGYGVWTMDGFTANYGALVGEAGSQLFLIGTGPIDLKGLSGDLKVGYWDSFYPDNSGTQTLSISPVPEPASWAMLVLGVAAVGAGLRLGRRDRSLAASAA